MDRIERMHRAVGRPTRIEMLVRHLPNTVDFLAECVVHIDLLPRQRKLIRIAGHEQGVMRGIQTRFDDGVESMRPAPTVMPAPPFAIEILPDLAGKPDIIREDAPRWHRHGFSR